MKWLFLYLLFSVTPEGDLRPKARMSAVFLTEEACNELGNTIQDRIGYEDPSLKSFSTCIPQSAYDGPIGKLETEKFDGE